MIQINLDKTHIYMFIGMTDQVKNIIHVHNGHSVTIIISFMTGSAKIKHARAEKNSKLSLALYCASALLTKTNSPHMCIISWRIIRNLQNKNIFFRTKDIDKYPIRCNLIDAHDFCYLVTFR